MMWTQSSRRPFEASEVQTLRRGHTCPVCHEGRINAREIPSRRKGQIVLLRQVYCPHCGSTGQSELTRSA